MLQKYFKENKKTTACLAGIFLCSLGVLVILPAVFATRYSRGDDSVATSTVEFLTGHFSEKLDTTEYDRRMEALANYSSSTPTTTPRIWPTKTVYPNAGAILPFKRVIAYYGNFYSKQMGALGEYPRDEMLAKLKAEVKKWHDADPGTPTIPAIEYIAITAQEAPGKDGKYRLRMPDSQIDYALELAKEVQGIVIIDLQVGLSTLKEELPLLDTYFAKPELHLALDPEFSMKSGARPGTEIGSFSADDINYTINYLSKIVKENNLPPKILIVHRFTQAMVKNYQDIRPTPEVQVVMVMDGWGSGPKKINTYQQFIAPEPVQFTGFKLFYKNDLKPPSERLLTPEELLKLTPRPIFIQYQ